MRPFFPVFDRNPYSDVDFMGQGYVPTAHNIPAHVERGYLHVVETVDGYRFTARARSTQPWHGNGGPVVVVDEDVEEVVDYTLDGATWTRYAGPFFDARDFPDPCDALDGF